MQRHNYAASTCYATIAGALLAGAMLTGCNPSTAITIAHPPPSKEKTVKVENSGRWPADDPTSVRQRACSALLKECQSNCESAKGISVGDVFKFVDQLPRHSFTWSGSCNQAVKDCCPLPRADHSDG